MMLEQAQAQAQAGGDAAHQWFYESNGERIGPASDSDILGLIRAGKLGYGSSVWTRGFPDWLRLEDTGLRSHLESIAPPPLSGDHVNNSLVWVLAFAPLIGLMLEYFIAGMLHHGNGEQAVEDGKYWFITVILNIVLSYFDENLLKKAGHNTDRFKGWIWLVPVYLYQRSVALKQGPAYFIVWIVCFVVMLAN